MSRNVRITKNIPSVAITIVLVAIFWAARPALATWSGPLTPVTLQLKWQHQFQFAGYYAAKHLGYYQDAGFSVIFKERQPGITVVDEVLEQHAEFGVGNPDTLLAYNRGKPVVVLGAIFQHAPDVLLTRAEDGINSPRDLRGKRVMLLGTTAPPIWAMLASQGINRTELKLQQLSWNIQDLIDKKTDAVTAYLTDQPYTLKQAGVPTNIMRPISYGVDFYGDCLITSKELADNEPDMVERFAEASFKGWRYAMNHPDEIIELIQERYNRGKTTQELMFEAEAMRELIVPKLVEMGTMSRSRWEHISKVYQDVGILKTLRPLDDFIHIPAERRRLELLDQWMPLIVSISAIIFLVVLLLIIFNRRLHRGIDIQTREVERNRSSLRQVIDLVPNMVYAKNHEGRFLLVNRAMADSLGTTVAELTGQLHTDVHHDPDQIRRMQIDEATVLDTGLPKMTLEESYRYRDGSTHWLQTTRLPFIFSDTDEPAVLCLSIDITERKRADEALKSSEERFKAIFNQTYQFSGILNLDGTVIQTNDTALDAFGVKREEVFGKPFWETPWWDHSEESRAWLKAAIKQASRGETLRKETTHYHPDGRIMTFDFSLKPARNNEGEITFLITEGRDITDLKKTEDELRQLNEELEERVAERTRNLESARDELMQSLEQLRQTQEELILSEKLAALGGLVAGVAHEINTPLGIGVTASSFLDEKITDLSNKLATNSMKRSDLEKFIKIASESSANIQVNLARAAELIKSFKQVAADQSSELPRRFNLHDYVDEVLMSLAPEYKHTAHTILNETPDMVMYSYPGAIMQIITNLMINALQHGFDEGDAGHIRITGEAQADNLIFTFSDDGKGIDPNIQDRIFEPFYTTTRNEGGTGLGLHIVYNTVTQTLDGSIQIQSAQGAGTSYIITIPIDNHNGATS